MKAIPDLKILEIVFNFLHFVIDDRVEALLELNARKYIADGRVIRFLTLV